MKTLTKLLLFVPFILFACLESVPPEPEEVQEDEFKWLKAISVDPVSDTLILIEAFADRTLIATGTFVETIQDTLIVAGLFSKQLETSTTYDTTYRVIANNKLQWTSSNNSVVTVSQAGVASPGQGGDANISATVAGISSNTVRVKVVGLPFLQLDPPAILVVTLPDSAEITGRVEIGALLSINNSPVDYDVTGRFSHFVQAGSIGPAQVTVSATDKDYPQAVRLLLKSVNFVLPPGPALEIDNPENQAVFFSDFSTISGVVEVGALLYIDGTEVFYDPGGNFSETVVLSSLGANVVTVRAVNSLFPEVFTEKTKTYTVYPPEDITGNWTGTVADGSTFELTIIEDPLNAGEYIFTGLYDWKVVSFLSVAVIDVPFSGTVDSDGAINGVFTAASGSAAADVVYGGFLTSATNAAGTVSYDGTYSGLSIDRTSNWTATKD